MKSVGSISPYSVQMQEMRTRITTHKNTFYAVFLNCQVTQFIELINLSVFVNAPFCYLRVFASFPGCLSFLPIIQLLRYVLSSPSKYIFEI